MNKKNLILGGILVILIVLVYLYQGPWQNQEQTNNFLTDVNMKEVDRIDITRKEATTTTLTKQVESEWKVEGEGNFYVASNVAKKFKKRLSKLTKAEFGLVSTNKDKKSEFRTNKKNGSQVALYQDGEKMAEFISGSLDSSTLDSTYISRPDSANTYAAQGVNLTSVMLRDDWRSKVIFDSPKDKMDKVRFQYPDNEFTVEKVKEEGTTTIQWQGTQPREFEVSEEKMDKVLQAMTNLKAARIPEQTFKGTGLSKHLIIVEASGNGISNTIMVGTKDSQKGKQDLYYAKKASSDNIYLITGQQRDKLERTIQDLE